MPQQQGRSPCKHHRFNANRSRKIFIHLRESKRPCSSLRPAAKKNSGKFFSEAKLPVKNSGRKNPDCLSPEKIFSGNFWDGPGKIHSLHPPNARRLLKIRTRPPSSIQSQTKVPPIIITPSHPIRTRFPLTPTGPEMSPDFPGYDPEGVEFAVLGTYYFSIPH
jgi:hypothetical protein